MITQRFLQAMACLSTAFALSACGMFGSKESAPAVAHSGSSQEFDPYSNSWRSSERVVTPPPSQPNATLAQQAEAAKREDSTLNKAGRAMSNTASAVGRAVKKPLGWLPFGKKEEVPATVE